MDPLKNELSAAKVRKIAEAVQRVYPAFSVTRFCKGLSHELESRELKQRVVHVADRLERGLEVETRELFQILVNALSVDECDARQLRGFLVWPLTEIVARRGHDCFPEAMAALAEMTRYFTAEFALRPFLQRNQGACLKQLHAWCEHPDEHVRRLVSEGSRPFLPWGGNLPQLLEPPYPTLELLEKLYDDPSAYVRLSVSNHLNDFSKQQPELVVETLRRWGNLKPAAAGFPKLARHACRTLLKAGHPAALEFHGYRATDALEILDSRVGPATVRLGEHLTYELSVRNSTEHPVAVMFDYAIHHRKANGSWAPKVFKGRTRELGAGETWKISGRHSFKPISTRIYYDGSHRFEPRLNGRIYHGNEFTLVTKNQIG